MLNQPKEFNLIAINHARMMNAEIAQSIVSGFDNAASGRPNMVIWGGYLNNDGGRLLQQAFTFRSIHLAQFYDGGACIPFGAEGQFKSGFFNISQLLPNNFMNYIYPGNPKRPFSAERWIATRLAADSDSNFQVTVMKPGNRIIKFLKAAWNFIRYKLTGNYIAQASIALNAGWVNYAATEAGEAICNNIVKDLAQHFHAMPELSVLLNDANKPSFVRLLQASLLAKDLLSKQPELKLLANMFLPKPYVDTPADKFFLEKRAQLNKVIGQHTPRDVPVPPIAPELPHVVIDMPANNAFVQNFDRQQAVVENAHVAPDAAVVSVEPPKL